MKAEARPIPIAACYRAHLNRSLTLAISGRELFDRIDAVGVERHVANDFGDPGEWTLIGPDRVFRSSAIGLDRVVRRIALIGTMGFVLGAREQTHVDIGKRDIEH